MPDSPRAVASGGPPEGSQLLWPLTFDGQMLGVLRLSAQRPGAFEPREAFVRALDRFARLLSVTIYRSDLYYQSEQQLQAIQEVGRLATHPLPVEQVCAHTLRLALRTLHVEVGTVALLREGGALQVVAQQGGSTPQRGQRRHAAGISDIVAATGKTIALPDLRKEPGYVARDPRILSELAVPIIYNDTEVLGVITVQSFEEGRFREENEEVIRFLEALANQTAVALKTSGLRAEAIEHFGLRGVADTAITNADFYQRILAEDQQRRARQEVQQDLSRRLMRSDRVQDILHEVVSLSLGRASGDGACLYLLEDGALSLKERAARRGAHPRWLHEYTLGQEVLDKTIASFSDAGAEQAWVIGLPEESVAGETLPACDAVMAPLYGRWRMRGLLCVLRLAAPERAAPGQNETELLASIAGPASVAIEKLRQREQMRALHAIDRAIGAGQTLESIFALVMEGITLTAPGDGTGYIALGQGIFGQASPALYRPDRGLRTSLSGDDLDLVVSVLQTVRPTRRSRQSRDSHHQRYGLTEEARSVLAAPILQGDSVRGALVFWHARADAFTEEDEEWTRLLAAEAAIAIGAWERTRQLAEARDAADKANRAKSAFLATMSHEIRTPMHAVSAMTDLILGTPLTARQRYLAQTVHTSSELLKVIIGGILDFSKIEAGNLELVSRPFRLRECIELALEIVAPATREGVDLAYLVDATVPDWLEGDDIRLRQILVNVLGNAVKFTEQGEVALTVAAEGCATPAYAAGQPARSWVALSFAVRDTGIGISEEHLVRIFQPFIQGDAATARRYGGTGLGLAISKHLCEMMGGSIWVESTVGTGTTIHFTIRAPEAAVPEQGDGLDQGVLAGARALIVDDNEVGCTMLTLLLEQWGLVPEAFLSPDAALAAMRGGRRYDLALLDMQMSDTSLHALAAALRAEPGVATPGLALLVPPGSRLKEAPSGVVWAAHVHKPITAAQLRHTVIGILSGADPASVPHLVWKPDPDFATRYPLRILVAEDNAINQQVALELLASLGYDAEIVANGLDALVALHRRSFDIVLLDIRMPELDGLETARHISAWPERQRPRMVAMSASALDQDRDAVLKAGMHLYLGKPIQVLDLQAALVDCSQWVQEHGSPQVAGLDASALARLRGTKSDRTAQLVRMYIDETRECLAQLRSAAAAGQAETVGARAHNLKSTSALVGAEAMALLSAQLEECGRSRTVAGLEELVARLEREFRLKADALVELCGGDGG